MKTKMLLCGAVLLLATGCQRSMAPVGVGDTFKPEEKGAVNIDHFAMAQAANGARTDGMLYAYHFDGDKLNSLGREKLELMLCAPGHSYPLVVYLDIPADDHTDARRQAVTNHLSHEYALKAEQFQLVDGYNPNCSSPVGTNLDALTVLQQPSAGPANVAAPAAGAPSGGGASGGGSSGAYGVQ